MPGACYWRLYSVFLTTMAQWTFAAAMRGGAKDGASEGFFYFYTSLHNIHRSRVTSSTVYGRPGVLCRVPTYLPNILAY